MTDTVTWEGSQMKREGFVLNLLCVLLALAFLGVVVWNVIALGTVTNFLTIDSLFLTVVFTLLALVLLINPIMSLRDAGVLRNPLKRKGAEVTAEQLAATTPAIAGSTGQAALPAARASVPATTVTKRTARTVPPDVENMVNRLKRSEENQS
ncbi:MAG: hypothetical protein AUG51_04205 [Acidobacteria bacterium 13_1_20CM_3_53_8]|nr:MAG: hypothetical protein AUG51_04205 [Acidobacteria bacterium 13_1_20CM_3_53_8]